MRVRFWPPVTTTGDCDSDSTYGSERRLPSLWCVVPHQSLAEELLFSQGTENACWNSCHDRVLGNIGGTTAPPPKIAWAPIRTPERIDAFIPISAPVSTGLITRSVVTTSRINKALRLSVL